MPEANPRRNFLMVGARCPSLLFYPTLPRPVSNGLRSLGPNKGTNVDQAALKCVYLAIMSIDPTGKGRKRWVSRWKAPLNAFELAFPGRLTASRN